MNTVMTENDPVAWLEARAPAVPPALLDRLKQALAERSGSPQTGTGSNQSERDVAGTSGTPPLAVILAEAAIDQLRNALTNGEDRDGAYDLLAADALLTYAFEAAAEHGPEAISACARVYGPERLAALLEP